MISNEELSDSLSDSVNSGLTLLRLFGNVTLNVKVKCRKFYRNTKVHSKPGVDKLKNFTINSERLCSTAIHESTWGSIRPAFQSEVEFSDWATPILPVLKGNNKVRIYGATKLHLNAVMRVDQCPLPKINGIFTALSGGKKFSKINLTHDFLIG